MPPLRHEKEKCPCCERQCHPKTVRRHLKIIEERLNASRDNDLSEPNLQDTLGPNEVVGDNPEELDGIGECK